MVPRLVPEISSLDAFCDGAGAGAGGAGGAGIGDSRSWILTRSEYVAMHRMTAVRSRSLSQLADQEYPPYTFMIFYFPF